MTEIYKYKTNDLSLDERYAIFHAAMLLFRNYHVEEVDYDFPTRTPLKKSVAWIMDNFPRENDTLQVSLMDRGEHVLEVIWRRAIPQESKELFITFIIDPPSAAKILDKLKPL